MISLASRTAFDANGTCIAPFNFFKVYKVPYSVFLIHPITQTLKLFFLL